MIPLKPSETKKFSLADLIENALPDPVEPEDSGAQSSDGDVKSEAQNETDRDDKGADLEESKMTPQDLENFKNALEGEVSWFTSDPANVFGRVIVQRKDDQNTRASLESYSCGYNLVLCGAFINSPFAQIDFYTRGFVGPMTPKICTAWDPNGCYGDPYGSGEASYSWSSTDAGITPISGSSVNPDVGLFGQVLGNGGAQGRTYNARCSFLMNGTAKVVCPVPTGDVTAFHSWADDQGQPAIGNWVQTLTPAGNYVGQVVTESDYSPATDSCWFNNAFFAPIVGVTGSTWTLSTTNQWFPDQVGWKADAAEFYQIQRARSGLPLPCGFEMFQKLTIQCAGGAPQTYKSPVVLRGIISGTGVSSGRDGQSQARTLAFTQ